jgi:hypothetical protein
MSLLLPDGLQYLEDALVRRPALGCKQRPHVLRPRDEHQVRIAGAGQPAPGHTGQRDGLTRICIRSYSLKLAIQVLSVAACWVTKHLTIIYPKGKTSHTKVHNRFRGRK